MHDEHIAKVRELVVAGLSALMLTLVAGIPTSPGAVAGEEEAKALLKAMTDYMTRKRPFRLTSMRSLRSSQKTSRNSR